MHIVDIKQIKLTFFFFSCSVARDEVTIATVVTSSGTFVGNALIVLQSPYNFVSSSWTTLFNLDSTAEALFEIDSMVFL